MNFKRYGILHLPTATIENTRPINCELVSVLFLIYNVNILLFAATLSCYPFLSLFNNYMNFIFETLNLSEQRCCTCARASPIRLDYCTGESPLLSDSKQTQLHEARVLRRMPPNFCHAFVFHTEVDDS